MKIKGPSNSHFSGERDQYFAFSDKLEVEEYDSFRSAENSKPLFIVDVTCKKSWQGNVSHSFSILDKNVQKIPIVVGEWKIIHIQEYSGGGLKFDVSDSNGVVRSVSKGENNLFPTQKLVDWMGLGGIKNFILNMRKIKKYKTWEEVTKLYRLT